MKNYEEMTKYVLEVRDEYVRKKKKRQAVIRKYTPVVSGFCVALIVGFGSWQHMSEFPDIPTESHNTEIITDITETTSSTDTTHEHTTLKTTIHHTTVPVITHEIATEEIFITDTLVYTTTQPAPETEISTSTELQVTEELPVITDTVIITEPVITEEIITDFVITEPVKEEIVTEPVITETVVTEPETTDMTQTLIPDEVSEVTTTASDTTVWEELPINQQYNMAEFGTPLDFYMTVGQEVSADKTGDFICKAYMSGYDYSTDTYYHCYTDAFHITDSDDIAIKFGNDDRYYLYTITNGGNEHE
ncbi:MAG: hypothetical protein K2J39_03135 [Ruminococcus sp.]|nr:hypothetical protein [Ruminococcus sp.]